MFFIILVYCNEKVACNMPHQLGTTEVILPADLVENTNTILATTCNVGT